VRPRNSSSLRRTSPLDRVKRAAVTLLHRFQHENVLANEWQSFGAVALCSP